MSFDPRKHILKIGGTIWIHYQGRTFTIDAGFDGKKETVKGPRGAGHQADGVLKSPMPGKILKVNFKINDSVKAGETICVLEAMKMEYALKAPFDGKLATLVKKAGDQVALDEKIGEIVK